MISCHGLQLNKYGVVQVTIASDASFHQRLPIVPSAKHFILNGYRNGIEREFTLEPKF